MYYVCVGAQGGVDDDGSSKSPLFCTEKVKMPCLRLCASTVLVLEGLRWVLRVSGLSPLADPSSRVQVDVRYKNKGTGIVVSMMRT